jgi:hypothetical protein
MGAQKVWVRFSLQKYFFISHSSAIIILPIPGSFSRSALTATSLCVVVDVGGFGKRLVDGMVFDSSLRVHGGGKK